MTLNWKYENCFLPPHHFSLIFVHKIHGEKIIDEYDCPLFVAENFETKFFQNIKTSLFSWQVTMKKDGKQLISYFNNKNNEDYVFYVKRIYCSYELIKNNLEELTTPS